ncbi:MAG: amino acid carrier protein [Clostridiales bacterium]|nr:amino acid carrier protein [Clostridiales bacterium]
MAALRALHQMIWGPWTLAMFLGTGIWFTVRSGCFQVRRWRYWLKATAGQFLCEEHREDGQVSQIQSACTALAATVGTGNIVGVATALAAGGPGAIFWMWVSAAVGMMTAYAETCLGIEYRSRAGDGHWLCGPMIYMERGLGSRTMGMIYAGLAVLASVGMGSMVQANSVGAALASCAGIPVSFSALFLTGVVALILVGGIHRIARVAERLMPVAAGIYIAFSLIVILSCASTIPCVLRDILSGAFSPLSAGGGIAGFLTSRSIRIGLSRGVFSNEAGLGTLAVLHGQTEDTTPEQQGMWAMFEVFFDTIVLCTLTAFVILCAEREFGVPAGIAGAQLAAWCFAGRLGRPGELLVSAAMAVFAFATILAWYYTGRQTAEYLTRSLSGGRRSEPCGYLPLYLAAVFFGCVGRLEFVWLIADICNGLMAYPNLLALWLLASRVNLHVAAK